jgi:hypothetical protein
MTEPEFPMPGEGPFFTEYLADIQASYTPVVDDSTTPPTITYRIESDFGLERLTWPMSGHVFNHKTALISRFNERYAWREIGAETRERFLHNLQVKFNGMLFHYEHRFALYDDNAAKLKEYSEIIDRETGNTDKFLDTPGYKVTLSDGYLTNMREITGTDKITDPKGTAVEAMNRLMDELRDLEEEFIDEFDECFISLYLP